MSDDFSQPHPLTLTHIFHPSDFSLSPEIAFAHALKLALSTKAKLTVFHVNKGMETSQFEDFPNVRDTMVRWGVASEEGPGIRRRQNLKFLLKKSSPREMIRLPPFLPTWIITRPGLIVLATHQLGGQPFFQSIAEPVARRAGVMTLFIPPNTRGFVGIEDGAFNLRPHSHSH